MKFWKKTVTLRLPLWSILTAVFVLVILAGVLLLGQTNFRENLMLRTLDPEDVATAYISTSTCTLAQKAELSPEDTSAAIAAVNNVRLSGKPYDLILIGGGPEIYIFTLHDGTEIRIGCTLSDSEYLYELNGRHYYVCSENDGTTPPAAFLQLEELYQTHCQVYFG